MIFTSTRLSPAAVEFAVEDLFPRAEIEFAFGDGDDDFAAHDLAFHVGVGVVFAGAVVVVGGWSARAARVFPARPRSRDAGPTSSSLMNTDAVMCMALTRQRPSRHAALTDEFLDLRRDVDEPAPARDFKPKMFSERFHLEADAWILAVARNSAPYERKEVAVDDQWLIRVDKAAVGFAARIVSDLPSFFRVMRSRTVTQQYHGIEQLAGYFMSRDDNSLVGNGRNISLCRGVIIPFMLPLVE